MLGLTNALKQARATATLNKIDAAATAGKLLIFGTARPATGGDPGGTPLATIILQKPAGTVGEDGTLTLLSAPTVQVVETGAPVWGRLTDGDGVPVLDGSVGIADADFIVDQEVIYIGAYVTLVAGAFAEGG